MKSKKYIQYLNKDFHKKSETLNIGDKNKQIYLFGKFLGDDIRITSEGGVINLYFNDRLIKSINLISKKIEI